MKMPAATYEELKQDFASVCRNFFKLDKERIGKLTVGDLWTVQHRVVMFRAFPDSNVNTRGRCLEYDGRSSSYLYHLGLHDEHIQTALLKIQRELSTAA